MPRADRPPSKMAAMSEAEPEPVCLAALFVWPHSRHSVASTCRHVAVLLSRTNHHAVCRYLLLLANNVGDHLDFLTCNWNVVSSNVMSFPALNSDLRAKWNAPLFF